MDTISLALFTIPALVMGIVGLVRSRRRSSQRGLIFGIVAIAGVVLGAALMVLGAFTVLSYVGLFVLLIALAASIVSLVLAHKAKVAAAGPSTAVALSSNTNGLALASVIVVWFSSIVGLILGHVALSQLGRTGEQGRGMALTAVIAGWTLTGISVVATVVTFAMYGAAIFALR